MNLIYVILIDKLFMQQRGKYDSMNINVCRNNSETNN